MINMEVTSTSGLNTIKEYDDDEVCAYCGTQLWLSINICTTFAAVFGNTLTISAILFSKKLSSRISNHFIFSLAVSDLLVGFSIPYHMCFYIIYNFGKSENKCLFRFVLTAFACASSICNIFLIAADRYIAVVYALHYIQIMSKKIVVILITMGWLASFSMAAVPIVWNEWHEGIKCEVIHILPNNYLQFIVCPLFILIWVLMLLLYSRICREASGQEKRIRNTPNLRTALSMIDSKSSQVVLLILGCFTFCWLPYFVVTLYARITRNTLATIYEVFLNIAVANSGMNPIIYAWKNAHFRKAFFYLIKCHRPNSLNNTIFVTNHSKKNSMNGIQQIVEQ